MNAVPRAASISAAAALVLAAVWMFWPLTLGGGTTYVTTHGISMEPRFHTGDLAILRSAGSYSVGDIVAYRSDLLDTIVMHRIVDMDGDRFVIQGDNNDWLDEERPTEDELLGTLLLRVPQGGRAIGVLTSPGALGLVGVAALALVGAARRPRRGRHNHRAPRRRIPRASPAFSAPVRAYARQLALGAGGVAVLAGVGGGILLALPSTQTESRSLQVVQQGEFSYRGTAEAGTTYPDGVVATGDTVWTQLATGLSVSFTNTVSGPDLAGLQGALRLDVTVASPDGWSTYLNSSPVVALDDGSATASVPIDTARATDLLRRHYAEIGTSAGQATLTVTPAVATTGTVRGRSFEAGSLPGLDFTLDATSLRLAGEPDTVLAPSTETAVAVDEVVPRTLPVLSLELPIGVARALAAVVLAGALITLGGALWIGRTGRGDVADEFVVRHAARILPVATFDPGGAVIDVADPEALHRVAERFDTLVLHHAGPEEDVFAVRDVDMTYRFVVPGGSAARGRPPVPQKTPAPVPEDLTGPLPVVPPPLPPNGSLWGRLAPT
ncbi:MAG TPA: signal peptidase I [Blastococcus sp.]|nr:signal peptidase I [Blastococcus sp.]